MQHTSTSNFWSSSYFILIKYLVLNCGNNLHIDTVFTCDIIGTPSVAWSFLIDLYLLATLLEYLLWLGHLVDLFK